MNKNRNILIIANDRDTRDLLFKYIASKFEECTCTAYGFIKDIRAKNKHIKIATPQLCLTGHHSPDLIIIDSALEYEREYYIEECYSCVKSPTDVISVDISDIIEPMIKNEIQIVKNKMQDLELEDCQGIVF